MGYRVLSVSVSAGHDTADMSLRPYRARTKVIALAQQARTNENGQVPGRPAPGAQEAHF
jgi:hypothetical protein